MHELKMADIVGETFYPLHRGSGWLEESETKTNLLVRRQSCALIIASAVNDFRAMRPDNNRKRFMR